MERPLNWLGPRYRDSRYHRWSLAIRGVLALIVGLMMLVVPLGGLVALVALVATLLVVDGLIALALGLWYLRGDRRWWIAVLQGLASLSIATLMLSWPAATLLSLVWLTAAWAIWQGVTEIMMARYVDNGAVLVMVGALSVVLGVIMIAMPAIGAMSLAVMVAVYAVVRGISLLVAAFRGQGVGRLIRA